MLPVKVPVTLFQIYFNRRFFHREQDGSVGKRSIDGGRDQRTD